MSNGAATMTNEQLAEQVERLIGHKIAHIEHRRMWANDYEAGWREGLHSLRDELLELIRSPEIAGVEDAARRVT